MENKFLTDIIPGLKLSQFFESFLQTKKGLSNATFLQKKEILQFKLNLHLRSISPIVFIHSFSYVRRFFCSFYAYCIKVFPNICIGRV